MELLVLIVTLLPLLAAIISYALSEKLQQKVATVSVVALTLTFASAFSLLILSLSGESPASFAFLGKLGILLFDPLSVLMGFVISGISLIVHVYSVRYMADEKGYPRFFTLLGLMTSSLLLMVFAGDLITLLIAWNLIGVLLYFLLGHNTADSSSQRYAMWTLITYRFGDLPMLLAAVLLYDAYGTWNLNDIFAQLSSPHEVKVYFGMSVIELSGLLIAFSAFARSAQFILHTWLPYTMSGPTPVSALMHAGIVNAGGFVLNRFAPLYMQTHDVLHLLFIVGLVTAVVGSILMLTQNDIKKALGYSTMGQMGFMIMECGVGAFSLAVFHLIAHGLFKGTMFLGAGGVIGEARQHDKVPKQELYTYVIERKSELKKLHWSIMGVLSLVFPLAILFGTHWIVDESYYDQQGAVVLLFFGWITGAQMVLAAYKMQSANPWRLFSILIATFAVVVMGYAYISHAFDQFLYPTPDTAEKLYQAAGIDPMWYQVLVVFISAIIVAGWYMIYSSEKSGKLKSFADSSWVFLYAFFSREFYVIDFFNWFSRQIFKVATKLNQLLRWG